MPQTNARLALVSYTLTIGGACGASALVASVPLSAPDNMRAVGGKYVIALTNAASTVPLHLDLRLTYTDLLSTVQEVPFGQYLISNAMTYGGSAVTPRSLILLPSGQGIALTVDGWVGSALRVYVLAASDSTAAASGTCSVWRV